METTKVSERYWIDAIIYTAMYIIFTIVLLIIEYFFLGIKSWTFLLLFRTGSILVDGFLWPQFEKTRNKLHNGVVMSRYWANTLAFIFIIQVFYIVRLFIFKSHFENLGIYIFGVLLSSFIIAPAIVLLKEKIKIKANIDQGLKFIITIHWQICQGIFLVLFLY